MDLWNSGSDDAKYVVGRAASPDMKVNPSSKPIISNVDYVKFSALSFSMDTANVKGLNQIFVQIHNRGLTPVSPNEAKVLMLVANGDSTIPPLPAGFASRITAADSGKWLAPSAWKFATPEAAYRAFSGELSARAPQIVEFKVNFKSLELVGPHAYVAVFVTALKDPLTSNEVNLDRLTQASRHVAYRRLKLV